MNVQSILHAIDGISTWVGKTAAWLIIALMTVVCVEVFKRYILNAPTAWIFDLDNMLYGTLFMLAGAYTLAQNAHVRGDFLYGSMRPRMQAGLDLVLYIVFFIPGIAALIYSIRLRGGIVGHRGAFDGHGGGPAGLPVQGDDSGRRGLGDASGRRRDRALHRLSQDRRMAEPPQGRRGDRRRRRAARAQRARGRRNAQESDRTRA